eukprot:6190725-Pleurochrysis_carterae.AAC.2
MCARSGSGAHMTPRRMVPQITGPRAMCAVSCEGKQRSTSALSRHARACCRAAAATAAQRPPGRSERSSQQRFGSIPAYPSHVLPCPQPSTSLPML